MAFGDFTVDRNSTKYVLGSGGDIISYATDEPAFEFNTDGSYKGLLVEPAATNICLQSEDFGTTWSAGGVTVTADDITSPSGVANADRLTSTNFTRLSQNITTTVSTNYALSIYVKEGTSASSWIIADFTGGTTTEYGYQINWSTNTITLIGGKTAATNPQFVEFVDGWYKFSMICASVDNTSLSFGLVPDASAGTNYIYAWGAQVETGPIATSYIPTTTASVTRVKDDITLGSASSLIGQTEGTLYVEVDWRGGTGTVQHLLSVNDGTYDNICQIYTNTAGSLLMYVNAGGGSAEVNQGVSYTGFTGIQKFAFAYKTDDFELYRNGSSISSSTSGSLAALATLTDIDLGQSALATQQANMWIRAVALFTRRLSDAEAQALTTL